MIVLADKKTKADFSKVTTLDKDHPRWKTPYNEMSQALIANFSALKCVEKPSLLFQKSHFEGKPAADAIWPAFCRWVSVPECSWLLLVDLKMDSAGETAFDLV